MHSLLFLSISFKYKIKLRLTALALTYMRHNRSHFRINEKFLYHLTTSLTLASTQL